MRSWRSEVTRDGLTDWGKVEDQVDLQRVEVRERFAANPRDRDRRRHPPANVQRARATLDEGSDKTETDY